MCFVVVGNGVYIIYTPSWQDSHLRKPDITMFKMAAYSTCGIKRRLCGEEEYEILEPLGEGTYGEVVRAVDREMGKLVALKMVKKKLTKREEFLHEVCISVYLTGHKGFISTYSSLLETSDHYVFSQELAPAGSLHSIIQPRVGIPENLVKRCALQITQALEYMHSRKMVHRDLKPDNILLMDKRCRNIKLSDFGLTQFVGKVVPSMSPINQYMSPELCKLKHTESIVVDPSVDIWALGVVLYIIITGNYPWQMALVENPLFQRFVYWQNNIGHMPPPNGWKNINRRVQDLFHILFAQDPSCRNQVGVVLSYLHFPWNFEGATQKKKEEDVVKGDSEIEVIVLDGDDEYIVIENHGDIECIVVNDSAS
ncbi:serine/threonine-protein kinase SBK1-like [Lithobates pipiens]